MKESVCGSIVVALIATTVLGENAAEIGSVRLKGYLGERLDAMIERHVCGANDPARVANEKVNALIRPFADGRRVIWLDVNAKLVDAKGDVPTDLASDRLHPTEKGYRIWFDALERALGK